MLRWYLRNWYNVSAVIAVLALVVLGLGWNEFDAIQRLMIVQFALINAHFFEEFGYPGGFPMLANKLQMHSDKPSHHPLNQASVAFGNNWFAIFVYLPAIIWHEQAWLTLAVSLFGFIELFMHSVVFNRLMCHWHNGGLWSSIGMTIAAITYLAIAIPRGMLTWWLIVPALAYPMLNYLVIFSWLVGKVWDNPDTKYPFADEEMSRFGRWTQRALAVQQAHGVDTSAHTHTPAVSGAAPANAMQGA